MGFGGENGYESFSTKDPAVIDDGTGITIGADTFFPERGYGLTYGSSFQPKKEPERKSD